MLDGEELELTAADFAELEGAFIRKLGQGSFGQASRIEGGGKFDGKIIKIMDMPEHRLPLIRNELKALVAAKDVDSVVNIRGWTADLGTHEKRLVGKFGILMETAGEKDLKAAVDANPKLFECKSDIIEFAGQLFNAVLLLQSAGVTHNDIAPDNITVKRVPHDTFELTLIDLGLAQLNSPVLDEDGVDIGQHSLFPASNRPNYCCPLARMRFLMHNTRHRCSGGYHDGWANDMFAAAMCIGTLRNAHPHHLTITDPATSFPEDEFSDLAELMRRLTSWNADERWGVDEVIASPFFKKWKRTTTYAGRKMQTRSPPASRFRVDWMGRIQDTGAPVEAPAQRVGVGSSATSTRRVSTPTQLSVASSSEAATARSTSRPRPPTAAPAPELETSPPRGRSASQAAPAASTRSSVAPATAASAGVTSTTKRRPPAAISTYPPPTMELSNVNPLSTASANAAVAPAASARVRFKTQHRSSAAARVGPPPATALSNAPSVSTASANAAVAPVASARVEFKTQRRPSAAARVGLPPTTALSNVPSVSTASANVAVALAAGTSVQMDGAPGGATAAGGSRVRTALSVLGTGVGNIFKAARAYATGPQTVHNIPQAAAPVPAGVGRSRKRSFDDDQDILATYYAGGGIGGRGEDVIGNGVYPHIVDRTKRARRTGAHQTVSWGGATYGKPPRRHGF